MKGKYRESLIRIITCHSLVSFLRDKIFPKRMSKRDKEILAEWLFILTPLVIGLISLFAFSMTVSFTLLIIGLACCAMALIVGLVLACPYMLGD